MKGFLRVTSLAIALVFAFSTFALAAIPQGLYIGGTADKYYSVADFYNNSSAAIADMTNAQPNQIAYVDENGKIAKVDEVYTKGSLSAALRDVQSGDLEPVYKDINGNEVKPEIPAPPTTGELKVDSVSAINARQIKVVYNQPVDLSAATNSHSALNLNNYYIGLTEDVTKKSISVLDNVYGGKEWEAIPGSTDNEVIIQSTVASENIFDPSSDLGIQKGKVFSLEIRNVESADGKGMSTQAFTLKSDDTTAPTVALGQDKVLEGATTVKFKFSEPVLAAAQSANAQLAQGAEVYLDGNKIDASKVKITDPSGTVAQASEVTVEVPALTSGTHTFTFVGVKDLAGNFLSPNPTVINVNVVKDTTQSAVPQVLDINQVDDNAVVFVTNVPINIAKGTIKVEKIDGTNDATIDLSSIGSDYAIEDATNTYLTDEPAGSTKAAYKLTFNNATNGKKNGYLSYDGANTILRKITINGLVNNSDSTKVMTTDYVKTVTFNKDTVAPVVKDVKINAANNGFDITFYDGPFGKTVVDTVYSKQIVVKYVKDGVTYSETLSKGNGAGTYSSLSNNVMTLTLTTNKGLDANGKLVPGATYTIALPDGIVNDGACSEPDKLDPARPHEFVAKTLTYTVPGSSTDYSVPQVSQADVTNPTDNNNIIKITLHGKNIDPSTVINLANYTWNGAPLPQGTKIEFYASDNPDNNTISIDLPDNAVQYEGNYPLGIKNIATKDGYKMLDTTVTVAAKDNYAPSIAKATITGSKNILVEFNENMAALSGVQLAQAVNNFTVTVNGVKYAISSVSDNADNDKYVQLTTATDFDVNANVVVGVTVDQNGNMVLKDVAGNKAANSSVTAVKQQ